LIIYLFNICYFIFFLLYKIKNNKLYNYILNNYLFINFKGYSVGSASLACFLLFSAFIDEVNFISPNKLTVVDITIPEVFIGGLLGAMTVFLFSSWALAAVGNAA
jgi:Na+/H+-translocating membrane pyrophosphatase